MTATARASTAGPELCPAHIQQSPKMTGTVLSPAWQEGPGSLHLAPRLHLWCLTSWD